ncbi:MAG: hypothetical protein QF809_04595 [Candidatus Peribacteraceae bacterium]|nr:hypothetical protein [Candidatus Peribacteraceae bacterium]
MRYFANSKAIKVIARRGIPLSLVFVFVWSIAGTAEAVSSWNPTLLVNTESFQEIDSGDGTTERELRFGDIDKKLMWQINENRFQFTRNVNVGGNLTATGAIAASGALTIEGAMSGASLHVSSLTTLSGAVSIEGNITTSGTLVIDGTSNLQGAATFGTTVTITEGALTDDTIVEGDLKAVDAAADEDILTFEVTTGDFEWHSKSDLGIGTATAITDGLIVEPDLDADVAAADGDWLQYDSTGTNFTWRSSAELLTDVGQNAGTDITADLEEETHASEHASGGGDAVDHDTLTNFVANEHLDWTNETNDLSTTGNLSGTTLNVDKNAFFFSKINASGAITTEGNFAASGTLSVEGTSSLKGAVTIGGAITLPTADGTRGQVLTTDGAGTVVWSGAVLGLGSGGVVALSPEYPNTVYFSSGSNTIGQLTYDYDTTNKENYYRWDTSKSTQQEYWISTRVRIPDNFKQWDDVRPVQLRYRTGSGLTAANQIDVRMLDTAGSEVTLTSGTDLANTSWTTATITGPDAAGTYTQGSYITLFIKPVATNPSDTSDDGYCDVGFINLNFETTAP